jgi:hypothetical protein
MGSTSKELNIKNLTIMYEIFVAKIEIVHFGDVTFATGKD